MGARVIECPTIQIVDPDDWTPVDDAIRRLNSYQWLLFTSATAVEPFIKRLDLSGDQVHIPIAVVGTATARRLKDWHLEPSLVPSDFRAEGLLAAFPSDLSGTAILFPRAETARELLPDELRRRGSRVDVVTVYRTVKAEAIREIVAGEPIDCAIFTSPSTIRYLAEELDAPLSEVLKGAAIAAIGPVTRDAAEALGLHVSIVPQQSTIEDLVSSVASYFR